MMVRWIRILMAALLVPALPLHAHAAALWCFVYHTTIHDSVDDATVRLDYLGRAPYMHYEDSSWHEGWAQFSNIAAGTYTVTASHPGVGFGSQVVEVTPDGITYTSLQLSHGAGGGNWDQTATYIGYSTITNTTGPQTTRYYLDVGADSILDYHLVFGPMWYTPPDSMALRPGNHQLVTIEGTLFNYARPPLLIVRAINRAVWRPFIYGDGSAGGQIQYMASCSLSIYERYEATGRVLTYLNPHTEFDSLLYIFRVAPDTMGIELDFGARWYSPPDSLTRPSDLQIVTIVGGFTPCANPPRPHVIVYELNGHLWRVPGDTTGFGMINTAIGDGPPPVVEDHTLLGNYPNPYNGSTTLTWTVVRPTEGTVDVVDLLGRRVALVQHGFWPQGTHSALWTCDECPSGTYFLRLQTSSETRIHHMTLTK